jgi:hypothetical protein
MRPASATSCRIPKAGFLAKENFLQILDLAKNI